MRARAVVVSATMVVASSSLLPATTILLGSDGELADRADAIVVGRTVAVANSPDMPATDYRVDVGRVLKGEVAGAIDVRVPGGDAPDGVHLTMWGAPELVVGEPVILFLVANADCWEVLDLAAGVFRERREKGVRVAVRDLGDTLAIGDADDAGERTFDGFARWLADRADGVVRPEDYRVRPTGGASRASENFTYFGVRQRWKEFERGEEVPWEADFHGEPELPGGGFAEFQTALAAWNDDPDTDIAFRYDGTGFASSGFHGYDWTNTILFGDPNHEVSGTVTCSEPGVGSGIVAAAVTWTTGTRAPKQIIGSDIIVNDGAGCWFTSVARAEQVFAHELGHSLGLGHSCGDDATGPCTDPVRDEAIMRAIAHNDERGAQLGDDDRAAIRSLYGPGAGREDGLVPPVGVVVRALSRTQVEIAWIDVSDTEIKFVVEVQVRAGKFRQAATAKGDATRAVVSGLAPAHTYVFRVRAVGRRAASVLSAAVTVTMPP